MMCVCVCVLRWTKSDQPSGMVVMEVNQLTGYSAVDLAAVRRQVGDGLKRVDDDGDKTVLYFDEVCIAATYGVGPALDPR